MTVRMMMLVAATATLIAAPGPACAQDRPQKQENVMPTTLAEMMAAGRTAAPAISYAEARALLDGGEGIAVDVRTEAEVAASGRVAGAIHADRSHLEFKADPQSPAYDPAFRKDKTLIVYCGSGARATLAGKTLVDMGYTKIRNLGGFKDWVAAGGAIGK
jgi:rhodanese-related sulfurtransferase